MSANWTKRDGISNTSDTFLQLSNEVGRLIRSSAHALISGHAESVGRTIIAYLAHEAGLQPSAAVADAVAAERERIAAFIHPLTCGRPQCSGGCPAFQRAALAIRGGAPDA